MGLAFFDGGLYQWGTTEALLLSNVLGSGVLKAPSP